jgi:lipopolysaccharide transport system ATP-binding protein
MSAIAVRVENLSKMYRIGIEEGRADTLVGSLGNLFKTPVRNLRRLARLSRFKEEEGQDILWALRDISFEVQRGEVLGVIGRNGAGKSTLLKLLSRITYPSKGRIEILGRVSSLLEVGTGFHPELTGRENVYLNGTILGMTRKEIDRKFDEIVDFSGVEKFLDTPVKRYSSGMRVRLAFSVAAHLEPEILLIDEVLAVGDVEFQKKCLGKMENIATGGRTILFVSHQMAAVQNLCTRAVLLGDGRLLANGPTSEIISLYMAESGKKSVQSLQTRQDRSGSGDIRFNFVRLKNEAGELVSAFRSGDDCILELGMNAKNHQAIKNLVISVGLNDSIGQRITHLSNETTNQPFSNITEPETVIQIRIRHLPLKPGRYVFTVFGQINGQIADWVKDAGYFEVEAGDFFSTGRLPPETQGSFYLDHTFCLVNEHHD